MHAYIGVLADRANVLPTMVNCVVASMNTEQMNARAWGRNTAWYCLWINRGTAVQPSVRSLQGLSQKVLNFFRVHV